MTRQESNLEHYVDDIIDLLIGDAEARLDNYMMYPEFSEFDIAGEFNETAIKTWLLSAYDGKDYIDTMLVKKFPMTQFEYDLLDTVDGNRYFYDNNRNLKMVKKGYFKGIPEECYNCKVSYIRNNAMIVNEV